MTPASDLSAADEIVWQGRTVQITNIERTPTGRLVLTYMRWPGRSGTLVLAPTDRVRRLGRA